jgi:hypothetical protein
MIFRILLGDTVNSSQMPRDPAALGQAMAPYRTRAADHYSASVKEEPVIEDHAVLNLQCALNGSRAAGRGSCVYMLVGVAEEQYSMALDASLSLRLLGCSRSEQLAVVHQGRPIQPECVEML